MFVFKREVEFSNSYIRINIELIWNQQQLKDWNHFYVTSLLVVDKGKCSALQQSTSYETM